MSSNNSTANARNIAPQKPWNVGGRSSGPTPFKPASTGRTTKSIQESLTTKPVQNVSSFIGSTAYNTRLVQPYGYNYGGVNSNYAYNNRYPNNNGYHYNNGLLSNGTSLHGNYGMYDQGMYVGSSNNQFPNNRQPILPPGFWTSFLNNVQHFVNFFHRILMLINQNSNALQLFTTAMLQLFDGSKQLHGELARFAFRILKCKISKKLEQNGAAEQQACLEGPTTDTSSSSLDEFWGDESMVG